MATSWEILTLRAALIVPAVIAVLGCFPPPLTGPRVGEVETANHPLAGCWWVGLQRSDTSYVRWPFPVRLTTDPTAWQGEFISLTAIVDSVYLEPRHTRIDWAPVSSSALLLSIGDGLTGVRYRLEQIHPDTLRGAGRYRVDTPEILPQYAKSITAARIACEEVGL